MKNLFRAVFLVLFGFELSNFLFVMRVTPGNVWFGVFIASIVLLVSAEVLGMRLSDPWRARLHLSTMKNALRAAFLALFGFQVSIFLLSLRLTPDYTWFGLAFTLLFVLAVVECVNAALFRKYREHLAWTNWAFIFIAVFIDTAGDLFHFYSRWSWYDQMAHFAGSAVAMAVIVNALRLYAKHARVRYPFILVLFLAHGLTVTLGVLYEIEEYLEDYFMLTNRLGDGRDTANDLLMNLIGATCVFLLCLHFFRQRKKRKGGFFQM